MVTPGKAALTLPEAKGRTMASTRLLVRIGALALVATTLTAGPVSNAQPAAKADVKLTIALAPDGSKVVGTVKSARAGCKKNVQVGLFWKDVGAKKFIYVADDNSNRQGKYTILGPGRSDIPPGRYYVRTHTSEKCQASRSATIRVS